MNACKMIFTGITIGFIIASIIAMFIGEHELNLVCGVMAVISAIIAAGGNYEYGKVHGKYDEDVTQ